MIVEEELYLKHYGRIGMRWGVRKGKTSDSSDKKSSRNKKIAVGVGVGAVAVGALFAAKYMKNNKTKVSSIKDQRQKMAKGLTFVSNSKGVTTRMKDVSKSPKDTKDALTFAVNSRGTTVRVKDAFRPTGKEVIRKWQGGEGMRFRGLSDM